MGTVEPSLEQLASQYADSDDETLAQPASKIQQEIQTISAATASGELDDDWSNEEDYDDWDSSEEAELASALEWADLREDMQARGNTGHAAFSSTTGRYQPNAQGGAKARQLQSQQIQQNQQRRTALPATANNMQRLDVRFSTSGDVAANFRARGNVHDDLVDTLGGHHGGMGTTAVNAVRLATGGGKSSGGSRVKDRSDRATVEQVLDPRTRMVLFKMLNRGVFSDIYGCISTGKEANVYHASNGDGGELAIKVYKTAILVFKDRDRYVVGDSRFQRFCKSNPRKMVKMWAEKEMRNLARIHTSGIPCPKPVQLRLHVLVMEFLGSGGTAAPRLKDANLPPPRMRRAYTEVVVMVRTLFQKCRLVHADLSEYNLLVHNDEVYMIDVSQSVELDHPRAFDFLREDCLHVNDYFRRQGVATLTTRELFDFTVDPAIDDSNLDTVLDSLMNVACSRPIVRTAEEEVAERVWAQAFIPKKLEEVAHYERDHARLVEGRDTEGIYYQKLAGMREDMSGARTTEEVVKDAADKINSANDLAEACENGNNAEFLVPKLPTSTEDGSRGLDKMSSGKKSVRFAPDVAKGSESDSDSGSEGSGDEDEWVEAAPKMTREEIQAARKEHKKAVKAANAARRTTKTPKHVKKKAVKGNKKK